MCRHNTGATQHLLVRERFHARQRVGIQISHLHLNRPSDQLSRRTPSHTLPNELSAVTNLRSAEISYTAHQAKDSTPTANRQPRKQTRLTQTVCLWQSSLFVRP